MKKNYLLTISLIFLLKFNGAQLKQQFNISNAEEEQFPFVVGLKSSQIGIEDICTGIIVSPSHVLTTSHCALTTDYFQYSIVSGCVDKTSPSCKHHAVQNVHIASTTVKTEEKTDEIAVLTLAEPLVFDDNTARIVLSQDEVDEDERVLRLGWKDDLLQFAEVKTASEESCHKFYNVSEENSLFFCTNPGYNSWADIGAPVVQDGKLVGVTLYTIKKASDMHVRTLEYSKFLRELIGEKEEKKVVEREPDVVQEALDIIEGLMRQEEDVRFEKVYMKKKAKVDVKKDEL